MLSSENDPGMTGADKAAYVKAMLEGIPGSPKSTAAPTTVQLLRKIPAPERHTVPTTAEAELALKLAAMIEEKRVTGDLQALTPEALQSLMAALCRLYGAQAETQSEPPILSNRQTVPATEIMVVCGALLQAAGLSVFELGMWQSWSGR
jgi:hypothetical protein